MNKLTIRLPDHILKALSDEVARGEMSLAAAVRVTLAKALNLPLETGDCRSFDLPPSSMMTARTIQVPYQLVWKAQETIRQGLNIHAIKDLREALKLGLYEAKCIVDILREEGV